MNAATLTDWAKMKATARHMNGRYWLGGIVTRRGQPFVVECSHKHPTRAEAIECAECMFHADQGSITADAIAKAARKA